MGDDGRSSLRWRECVGYGFVEMNVCLMACDEAGLCWFRVIVMMA